MNIILASASPRRQELLKRLYPEFMIDPADIDETVPDTIGPEFSPIFLSAAKAAVISAKYPDDLIIAADTVVICDGKILGKPANNDDAIQMLHLLSGKTHKVITGCCISLGKRQTCFSEESFVTFYNLTDAEIQEYVSAGYAYGKAGSYGIQDNGAFFVEKIDGDYYNIVGFPIGKLKREIATFLNEIETKK